MRKNHKFRVHDLSYDIVRFRGFLTNKNRMIVRYRTISLFFNENLWIGTPLYMNKIKSHRKIFEL